jgi:alanine-synthesizing transaminase
LHTFSHRLPWSLEHNNFSRLLATRRLSGAPLLDLTSSNPTEVLTDYPHLEIAKTLGSLTDFAYQPEPFGSLQARETIARYYQRHNVSITPEQIALTASTSEAYGLLFKLLCDPGDEILVPAPSYPLFEYLAALEAVRVVSYRLSYDGAWFIDMELLRSQISGRTRALVVVNPNNPTGSFLKTQEAKAVVQLAGEHALPIICDEVFIDYSLDSSSDRVPTLIGFDSVLSFCLNGLSKAASMPQLKLGWIVVNGPNRERQAAAVRLEIVLDTYLSVATPVQHALPSLLSTGHTIQTRLKQRIIGNLACGREILHDAPGHFLPTEGGWSAIIQLPRTRSEEEWITAFLQDYSAVVQPGYFFDMPSEAYIVVSLITPEEQFKAGMECLRHLLKTRS